MDVTKSNLTEDRGGHIGEHDVLVLGRSPIRSVTTEEGLHLTTPCFAVIGSAIDETTDGNDALSIDPHLNFTISLTNSVELDSLRDSGPCTGLPCPGTTGHRIAVLRLARTVSSFAALLVVLVVALGGTGRGREIGIDFSGTSCTPHETHRPAVRIMTSTGACASDLLVGSTD